MKFGNNNRFLGIILALLIALVSALSAVHLNAHQTPDTASIEDCLALHTTGLDLAIVEVERPDFVEPPFNQIIQMPVYSPVIRNHFRPQPRGPPTYS